MNFEDLIIKPEFPERDDEKLVKDDDRNLRSEGGEPVIPRTG